jgi:hypothetical protein
MSLGLTNQPQKIFKKSPNFFKVAKTVAKPKKCQNFYIKVQFESSNYLHRTTFETLQCPQQTMF